MDSKTKSALEYAREKIIMAAHPECETFEKALLCEYNLANLMYVKNGWGELTEIMPPITLARVMNCLDISVEHEYRTGNSKNCLFVCIVHNREGMIYFSWRLLNYDGTDCTLNYQSPETIQAIAKLLGWKESK